MDFILFDMDFGFVESKQMSIHITALDLFSCVCVCVCVSFLAITSMLRLSITV